MPKFVNKTLKKLKFKSTHKKQLAPHEWTAPIYGKNQQFAKPNGTSTPLNTEVQTPVQSVVGSFVYYGRAIDNTILPALNKISFMQASPTKKE